MIYLVKKDRFQIDMSKSADLDLTLLQNVLEVNFPD